MIILIDVGKPFEKIQHPFMIKTPESGQRENGSQHDQITSYSTVKS